MTVEPFSASTSNWVPSWAMKVSFVISHLRSRSGDNHSTGQVNCGAKAPRNDVFSEGRLAIDAGDEVAHFLDQHAQLLERPCIVRLLFDDPRAVGHRKGADAT